MMPFLCKMFYVQILISFFSLKPMMFLKLVYFDKVAWFALEFYSSMWSFQTYLRAANFELNFLEI